MKSLLVILFFLLPLPLLANNPGLKYKPAIVQLTGVLSLHTFPGPPNYESIEFGDEVERSYYLSLDHPVDVLKDENAHVDNAVTEKNVKVVQLAINGEDDALWKMFRSTGKGAHIKVNGALFHRFTGHHHTRILLEMQGMEPISASGGSGTVKRAP